MNPGAAAVVSTAIATPAALYAAVSGSLATAGLIMLVWLGAIITLAILAWEPE